MIFVCRFTWFILYSRSKLYAKYGRVRSHQFIIHTKKMFNMSKRLHLDFSYEQENRFIFIYRELLYKLFFFHSVSFSFFQTVSCSFFSFFFIFRLFDNCVIIIRSAIRLRLFKWRHCSLFLSLSLFSVVVLFIENDLLHLLSLCIVSHFSKSIWST